MRNNENHIFVDTNCLISFLCDKYQLTTTKDAANMEAIKYLFAMKGKKIFVSSLSIVQLTAKRQSKLSNDILIREIDWLLHKVNIVEFTKKDIEEAIRSEYAKDIEDLYQYRMSEKTKCLYIMTNNTKDFSSLMNVIPFKPRQIRMMNIR